MMKIVTAVYEKGVLRLLQPLNLRERQKVRIQVLPEAPDVSEEAGDDTDALIQRLVAKGLMRPRPQGPIPPDPVSAEERKALADRLGRAPGKSASEMIIEDRGEW
jgi:predicted DNA-binding antitoxin AbrB/MazE fold protein